MPFITEEIWQLLSERKDGESIMVNEMPTAVKSHKTLVKRFDPVKEIVSAIRSIRKDKDIPMREKIELLIRSKNEEFDLFFIPVIIKMANLEGILFTDTKRDGAASFIIQTTEFYIPLGDKLDVEAEIIRINEELKYTRGFLSAVMKKLDNERFVQNAPPAVIEMERKKKADAESKIKSLEERLKEMKSL